MNSLHAAVTIIGKSGNKDKLEDKLEIIKVIWIFLSSFESVKSFNLETILKNYKRY